MTSGVHTTPQCLNLPSPKERDTSRIPLTRPSLHKHTHTTNIYRVKCITRSKYNNTSQSHQLSGFLFSLHTTGKQAAVPIFTHKRGQIHAYMNTQTYVHTHVQLQVSGPLSTQQESVHRPSLLCTALLCCLQSPLHR